MGERKNPDVGRRESEEADLHRGEGEGRVVRRMLMQRINTRKEYLCATRGKGRG
jgi:hypothetical protein